MNWRIIQRNSTAKPRNLNELKKHKKRYAQTGYANECWIREIRRNSTAKPGNLNKLWKHWKRYAQTGYANEFWIIENKVWNKNSQYTRNNKGFFYHTWKKEADRIIFFKNIRKTFGW